MEKDIILKIFNQLHDGTIDSITLDNLDALIRINIIYLAERINPEYSHLYIKLINCELLTFKPWGTNKNVEIENIDSLELEINKAEFVEGQILISCLGNGPIAGGELVIKAMEFRIYDEAYNEITINDFNKVVKEYWNDLNNEFDK